MTTREQARAVIYGLACGDALGWPVEFSRVAAIRKQYGPQGITDLSQTRGEFTDDTQMTVALAEGLLDAHAYSVDEQVPAQDVLTDPASVLPFVAKRFVSWARSPENNRSPGTTCMAGCRALGHGEHWTKAGVVGSKGCGAMMRVAPVGLIYSEKKVLREIAEAQAICTHNHPESTFSAYLTAFAIRQMLRRDDLRAGDVYYTVLSEADHHEHSGGAIPVLYDLLHRVQDAVRLTLDGEFEPTEIMRHGPAPRLGESWHGDEALASALYCVTLADARDEGYVEAVRYAANTDGDSDSIACVAGAFAGAMWGIGGRGVPDRWISWVEKSKNLGQLADRLADLSHVICGS